MFPRLIETTEDRHRFFLLEAYKAAFELSDDPNTKVGAVIVQKRPDGYQQIARGANVISREVEGTRVELCKFLLDREWKLKHMMHAEPTVIDMAESYGYDVSGDIMYMPWVPCEPCADRIIAAGLGTLVSHKAMVDKTPEIWRGSINTALDKMSDAGIECLVYAEEIGEMHATFRNTIWTP